MAFITITKPAAGDPTTKDLIDDVIDNLVTLDNNIAASVGGQLINWSFEKDVDADGDPDGWSFTDYTGGSHARASVTGSPETSVSTGGFYAQTFTSTVLANGGGYADSTDFFEVLGNTVYKFGVNRWGSVADISSQMQVTWYDKDQTSISTTTCYQDTDTPTTDTRRGGAVISPSTARYAKVRLEGGIPATGTATGIIYFDNVYFDVHETIIGMGDFSSDANLIRSVENYEHHRIHLININTGSDAADLVADVSTDRQSTWKTGANSYNYEREEITGGVATLLSATNASSIPIADNQRSTSAQALMTGWIDIIKPAENYVWISWNFRHDDATSGPPHMTHGVANYDGTAEAVTDLRLDCGTFASGSWFHEVIK